MTNSSYLVRFAFISAICVMGLLASSAQCGGKDTVDFVGSLSMAIADDGAELLGLSNETRGKLAELAGRRAAEGEKLFSAGTRDRRSKAAWLATWVEESEQLGLRLLDIRQREKLTQLLLARDGMVTLSRPDVRKVLGIAGQQLKKIDELLEMRRDVLAASSPLKRRIAIGSFERKLQGLLQPAQLEQWERMAGLRDVEEPGVESLASVGDQKAAIVSKSSKADTVRLQFTFERTPWREVIDWLAQRADLSLHVGSMPPGSLTYDDKQVYTTDQTIERINRFLLPKGYTLIRSGKMLSVIGLQDANRDQMLDSLAEYVDLNELDRRGDNEVVKCLFTVVKADPKEAFEEIRGLVKLSTPLLLPKSKQLLVIETASKLRMVRETLAALESPDTDGGPVRRFELQHIRAEKILTAIRPLVGIEDASKNTGSEISLAASPDGKQIFATGSSAKLAIIDGIVKMLDKEVSADEEVPTLQAHDVKSGSLQAADDVLQTLLMGQDVRLAQEPKTNRLIVLGSKQVHKQVEETIAQLDGKMAVFEVLQLKFADPFTAISLVREMLDIPFYADEEDDRDHPRLDWDPRSKRIFVRGTKSQVDEVKQIIESLEKPREATKDSPLRLLPIQGERAMKLLETAKRFWTEDNDVLIFPPSAEEKPSGVLEREINGDSKPQKVPPRSRTSSIQKRQGKFVSAVTQVQQNSDEVDEEGSIKAQVTPRGILLHSTDLEKLNKFVQHLRTIAGPDAISQTRMAIFYLKHVRAEEAKSLLKDIRRGESSTNDDYSMGPLAEDADLESSRRRSFSRFSEPWVIADARLNRLIIQGTIAEVMQIEKHLGIIDRDKSIADVQVRGKARIIRLVHMTATKAAAIIRDAYAHELGIASSAGTQQQQKLQAQQLQAQLQQKQKQQQQPQAAQQAQTQRQAKPDSARGSDDRRSSATAKSSRQPDRARQGGQQEAPQAPRVVAGQQETKTNEPRMSLAVDEAGNALIIRAPEQLFLDVSDLILKMDTNSAQATEVVTIKHANPEFLHRLLMGAIKDRSSQPAPAPAASKAKVQPTVVPNNTKVQPRGTTTGIQFIRQ